MKNQINRRVFVKSGAVAGCALLLSGKLSAISNLANSDEIPDPKKLEYCGYTCPKDCIFMEASVKNDVELKKKAYETWEMKTRFGVEKFEPEKIYCFGCKNPDKPVGIRLQKCDVRNCVIDKKLESCIECKELTSCEKNLWTKFPEFQKSVIKMQEKYLEARS